MAQYEIMGSCMRAVIMLPCCRKIGCKLLAGAVLLWAILPVYSATAAQTETSVPFGGQINHLLDIGGYAVQRGGRFVASYNVDQPLIPASIIKIATGLAALHILGPEFHFITNFFITPANDLYIEGHGDPFLVSEEVSVIVEHLRAAGLQEVRDIILDDTAFRLTGPADGAGCTDNPYDAENSALAVNFNTVYFSKGPKGTIHSAEPQTPTIPLMVELGTHLDPGEYRLNITTGGQDARNVGRYVGELFQALLEKKGIACSGSIRRQKVPAGLTPVYAHRSSTSVQEGIQKLLLYSNNFIANQLFLACGAEQAGPPATWEKSRRTLQRFLQEEMGLDDRSIIMVEGSGLSRRNRTTVRAMSRILAAFAPYGSLLRERPGEGLQPTILIKSGTLTGVYSYAGYFMNNNHLDSFVLILNQERNSREQLFKLLTTLYKQAPREKSGQPR
jgi:D-alanyl-D-alanine carboxypeptidase/D-alanyl-D-alanine-endopeptidase (penicillin-binding protein 4)